MSYERGPRVREQRLRAIDARAAAMRAELGRLVLSVEPFTGSLPGTRVFRVPARQLLPSDHAVVERYPSRFRPLSEREIDYRVRGWTQRTRSAWGVG